jgi:hypothetical protein
MNSQLYWLVPDHILYWKLSGEIPAIEIEDMTQFIAQQVDKGVKHKVHLVIDAVSVRTVEHSGHISRDAFAWLAKNQWLGKVVVVIYNYQIQLQLNGLSAPFGLNWHNVSSMDDAVRVLKNSDTNLTSIPKLQDKTLIARKVRVENLEQSS